MNQKLVYTQSSSERSSDDHDEEEFISELEPHETEASEHSVRAFMTASTYFISISYK